MFKKTKKTAQKTKARTTAKKAVKPAAKKTAVRKTAKKATKPAAKRTTAAKKGLPNELYIVDKTGRVYTKLAKK